MYLLKENPLQRGFCFRISQYQLHPKSAADKYVVHIKIIYRSDRKYCFMKEISRKKRENSLICDKRYSTLYVIVTTTQYASETTNQDASYLESRFTEKKSVPVDSNSAINQHSVNTESSII